jgi:hypothetical protein
VPEIAINEDESSLFTLIDGQRIPANQDRSAGTLIPTWPKCQACTKFHPVGSCPLKVAGFELCPLCGIAHYGHARNCPHIRSETMVRLMLDTLKTSSEPRYLVDAATKYLRGVKGHLVHTKKRARDAAEAAKNGTSLPAPYNYKNSNDFTHNQNQESQSSYQMALAEQTALIASSSQLPKQYVPADPNEMGLLSGGLSVRAAQQDASDDEEGVEERLLAAFQNMR